MMSDHTNSLDSPMPDLAAPSLTTPAGFQANATLNVRRAIVLTANAAIWALLLYWFASILASGGWTALDCILLVCFAIGTPWTVLGFCNAVTGLVLFGRGRRGLDEVAPYLAAAARRDPITLRTAIVMTLRNENPSRALLRLTTIKASLDASGEGAAFSYFILSDTDVAEIASAEEALVNAWKARDSGGDKIVYRRRQENSDFKAGNVRDFCQRWGRDFAFMLPLDADSLMRADAILGLVRILQAHPRVGILQSLVTGLPSSSPFARLFQFGMRHGMREYTMGQAWWVGDCGPYWGHNALVRIQPFVEHCDLLVLPAAARLGGPILSHDQVEAVLMRRAGYEVRVMPLESGSYEDNPPDALAFMGRDVRWCQGNMQYVRFLGLPGLHPVSRFQLLWAILMFSGIPAWTAMIAVLPLAASDAIALPTFPVEQAKMLFAVFLLMHLSPKIAGLIDAVATPGEVRRFGGALRFTLSAAIEVVFSFLIGALASFRTSLFMLGLPFGKSIVWNSQSRDTAAISWRSAAVALWPQLLFGVAVCGALIVVSPTVLVWSLPLTAGYVLGIPFAVLTANPRIGRFMRDRGLAGIPEDFAPPPEIMALQQREGAA